jgi:uncharacterized membrane protein
MTNYKIIGGDGQQYGPVTADELRAWIAEGRLNAQSLVQYEGASEWKPLGSFSEFADALNPVAAPPQIATPANPSEWSQQVLAREPELRFGECLSSGCAFFSANPGFVIGAVTLTWLLNGAMMFFPFIGGILHLILGGVLTGGLYFACLRRMRGEAMGIGNIFDGFKLCFVQLMLAGAITKLLSQFGLMLCVLPGIYLFVAWIFALPLVADKRLEFWSAMELSRKVVTRVWFPIFLLLALAFLPFVVSQCIGGLKIWNYFWETYRDANFELSTWLTTLQQHLVPLTKLMVTWGVIGQVALLLSLFFAVGALMRAYENLFGERKP